MAEVNNELPSFPNAGPASKLRAISPNDNADLAYKARAIYVGGGGDIEVVQAGVTVLFKNVPQGVTLGPFFVDRVKAGNTTATNLVAFH